MRSEFNSPAPAMGSSEWSGFLETAKPYLTIASIAVTALKLIKDKDVGDKISELTKEIKKIREEVKQARRAIIDEVLTVEYRGVASKVLQIENNIEDYLRTEQPARLERALDLAMEVTADLEVITGHERIPDHLRAAYQSLLTTAFPLSIMIHELRDLSDDQRKRVIEDQLSRLLDHQEETEKNARRIGDQRVGELQQKIRRDPEPGETSFAVVFSALVDGEVQQIQEGIGSDDVNVSHVWRDAQRKYEALKAEKIAEAVKPVKDFFEDAEAYSKLF